MLVLLVGSVPVAMPAVLSVTMALGAKLLAREKAIVSRLESIEEMAGMEVLCSDESGTLTQNKLTLGDISDRITASGSFWDDYIAAFEDAISATSTDKAPWYVIP